MDNRGCFKIVTMFCFENSYPEMTMELTIEGENQEYHAL